MTEQKNAHPEFRLIVIAAALVIIIEGINRAQSVLLSTAGVSGLVQGKWSGDVMPRPPQDSKQRTGYYA